MWEARETVLAQRLSKVYNDQGYERKPDWDEITDSAVDVLSSGCQSSFQVLRMRYNYQLEIVLCSLPIRWQMEVDVAVHG